MPVSFEVGILYMSGLLGKDLYILLHRRKSSRSLVGTSLSTFHLRNLGTCAKVFDGSEYTYVE